MDYGKPERAEALAADYVAGTLRGPARRRFEALLPGHPALQAAVRGWQARLLPLAGSVQPTTPPARVWRSIEQRLWPAAQPQRWWQRLALWRGATGLAGVAVLALAVALVMPAPPQPPVVIVLQGTGDGSAAGFVASVSADGRSLVTRPLMQVALQSDRVLELWSVPPAGNPRSLGLIAADGLTVLPPGRIPATLLKGGTSALAVSVEPPGGSPTGVPTGPVVYAGKLTL